MSERGDQQAHLAFRLRRGSEAEYDRRHRRITAELRAEIESAGITRNVVLRLGTLVIVAIDHPEDAGAALARVMGSSASAAWTQHFADLVASEPVTIMPVWSLGDEAAPYRPEDELS
jgi:L-rhamnose mutarotase